LNLKIGGKISKIGNFQQKSTKNRQKISKIGIFSGIFCQKAGKNLEINKL
jgi:hypothetical protein